MTIGFSHKGNFWTSRYSFEPDSYGSVDNQLLSFKDVFIEGDETPESYMEESPVSSGHRLCWKHREQYYSAQGEAFYNNFFNEQSNSSIEFVCNDNPSMEKFFKSISIESNQNIFASTIRTNDEVIDNLGYKGQIADANKFVNREEALYSDFKYSLKNSTSHFNYCGYVVPDAEHLAFIASIPITNTSGEETTVPGHVWRLGKFFSFNSSNAIPRINNIITQDTENDDILDIFPYRASCGIALEGDSGSFFFLAVNAATGVGAYPFGGVSFENDAYLLRHFKYFIGSDDNLYLITNATFDENSFNNKERVGVMKVCDPQFYGDQIRGKYAKVTVSQSGSYGPSAFEIYGFNIQYEQSHLDSE